MTGNEPGYYEQIEVVIAEVKIITRVYASSQAEAQAQFDEGDWEARAEMVGDIRQVLSSEVLPVLPRSL